MPVPYAQNLAYRANARAVGRRWRDYLQLTSVIVVLLVVAAVTPHWWNKEFAFGYGVGSMAMALATLRLHDPQVSGYVAETFSIDALKRVRGWTVVDNLPFDRVDIDHVAVTPSTVLAVESKHHGYLPPSRPRHVSGPKTISSVRKRPPASSGHCCGRRSCTRPQRSRLSS